MKKINLFITLLVIVTGLCSFGYSVFNDEPKQESVKFCVGVDTLNGVLLSFSGFVSSKEVVSWMRENDMRGATNKELQAFSFEIGINQNSSVVALGSEVMSSNTKSVQLIINDKRGITLDLYPSEGKWNGSFYKFLAIAKTSI